MRNQINLTENPKTPKIVFLIFPVMFLAGFIIWLLFYPVTNGSFAFWAGAVLMGIPGYAAGESLGSLGLDSNFAKNRSKAGRITFGVFWGLFCLSIYGVVLFTLSHMVV